ncbi:hypothetical protein LXL04_000940 [Taraxacum kok-saghyz]
MEKRTPFFLTRLLRRSPQNSESSEQSGWENIEEENTRFGGWGSSPVSTSSGAIANGWADEPPKHEYNGWGSSYPDGKSTTPETSTNGWLTDDNQLAESEPEFVNGESFPCPPVPSAPPLPDNDLNDHDASNTFNHLGFDFVKKDVVSMDQSKNGDGSCVVCWEAPVDGACVPCGHMHLIIWFAVGGCYKDNAGDEEEKLSTEMQLKSQKNFDATAIRDRSLPGFGVGVAFIDESEIHPIITSTDFNQSTKNLLLVPISNIYSTKTSNGKENQQKDVSSAA